MNQNLPKLILVGVGIAAVIVAIMLALKPATTATSAIPVAEPEPLPQQLPSQIQQLEPISVKATEDMGDSDSETMAVYVDPSKVEEPCKQIIINDNVCISKAKATHKEAYTNCGLDSIIRDSVDIGDSLEVDLPTFICTNNADVKKDVNLAKCNVIEAHHSMDYDCPMLQQQLPKESELTIKLKKQEQPNSPETSDMDSDAYQDAYLNEMRRIEWLQSLGQVDMKKLPHYQAYSLEVLDQLAKQCDLTALTAIRWREGITKKQINWTYYVSAVCGASNTLSKLVPVPSFIPEIQTPKDIAIQRTKLLLRLAMYEVDVMRGDKTALSLGVYWLNDNKIILTEAEKQTITSYAKKTYANLKAQRAAWGFPPFNNYIPDDVNERVTALLYTLDNPSGWGLQYYEYAYDGSPPW